MKTTDPTEKICWRCRREHEGPCPYAAHATVDDKHTGADCYIAPGTEEDKKE
ncbi:MAG: hypothetical protein SWH78_04275 [Thermodesulfobacteriota bacterium]|nr:hypothetical protein [Thermodesulfobacteriota bacterium]